ncbi:hypothetical protein [Phytohabitans aurantiacus]|uniref:Transcriptional regulator n=1 Tax=Phytohabitans aurantiacus TaxID=3016789 RepID=A0ABQ5R1K5_9ACTN|nr:hypothetical protein [Phytohabitans aurantiacus]GLI00689.1 hypothetical protein Pa4123_59650 [Phytohabitans aurantiacus]
MQYRPIRATAEELGVEYNHLRFALYGQVRPNDRVRRRLPRLLGHPLEDLFSAESLAKPHDASKNPWRVQS